METKANWASTVGGGMPVLIGEWGVGWMSRFPSMDCNNIRLWYSRFDATHARAADMPTAVWDDGGWFQLYDHATRAFSSNLIDCIDGTCVWTERPLQRRLRLTTSRTARTRQNGCTGGASPWGRTAHLRGHVSRPARP